MVREAALLELGLRESEIRKRQTPLRRRFQEERRKNNLAELLQFVQAKVSRYREHAKTESLALTELPLLRRADVRRHFDRLVADGVDVQRALSDGVIQLFTTSGTTGERLQVLSDLTMASVPDEYEAAWKLQSPTTTTSIAPRS